MLFTTKGNILQLTGNVFYKRRLVRWQCQAFGNSAVSTFRAKVSSADIANFRSDYSDKEFVPLLHYFQKFSYFEVTLPMPSRTKYNGTDDYPMQHLCCEWKYAEDLSSLFDSNETVWSMEEYELMTGKMLVKYLRTIPFNYYESDTLAISKHFKLINAIHNECQNTFNPEGAHKLYAHLYESKCTHLFGQNPENVRMHLLLSKTTIKDFLFNFNAQVNGHLVKNQMFGLRENDEIEVEVPSSELLAACQRRLLSFVFKLHHMIAIEKNKKKYKMVNIYLTKRAGAVLPSLMEKLCLAMFHTNVVHAVRHFIVPDPCGIERSQIVVYEDEHIVVCNKPHGVACHYAADTQSHHNDSLVNVLLFYCPELQKNIQKDSMLWKTSLFARLSTPFLPSKVSEKQLTISPGLIHRLDKQTSGILVVAKTVVAMSELFKQWESLNAVEKEYLILVHGAFDGNALRQRFKDDDYSRTDDEYYTIVTEKNRRINPQHGCAGTDYFKCECWIGPRLRKKRALGPLKCFTNNEYFERKRTLYNNETQEIKDAFKMSCTHFYKLQEFSTQDGHTLTLLKCKLVTGRTHQIRLHAQYCGMAIIGDRFYPRVKKWQQHEMDRGRKMKPDKNDETYNTQDVELEINVLGLGRNSVFHALHAQSLKFMHPITKKAITMTAELPPFFDQLLQNVHKYTSKLNAN